MLYTPPVAPTDSGDSVSPSDRLLPRRREVAQIISPRGRIRLNNVSVGEPVEGSLLPLIYLGLRT